MHEKERRYIKKETRNTRSKNAEAAETREKRGNGKDVPPQKFIGEERPKVTFISINAQIVQLLIN